MAKRNDDWEHLGSIDLYRKKKESVGWAVVKVIGIIVGGFIVVGALTDDGKPRQAAVTGHPVPSATGHVQQ